MLGRKELKNYRFLFDGIENDTIKQRARVSLEYYIDKATFYKLAWNILSFAGIVLPAAATVFYLCGSGCEEDCFGHRADIGCIRITCTFQVCRQKECLS